MAKIIRRLRPRAFVFENVRGLLNARWTAAGERGEIWRDVQKTFKTIPGYSVASSLVFAKDYGVPQNRPRVLLVGVRDDVVADHSRNAPTDALDRGFLPRGMGGAPDLVELLGDLVDPDNSVEIRGGVTEYYPGRALSKTQKELRTPRSGGNPFKKGDLVTEQRYSKHSEWVRTKFELMHLGDGKIPEGFETKKFAQRKLPPTWGEGGPTITATSLSDDYVHYLRPRTLTVREWARLQTFPDWYQFDGNRTTGGLRRAGNPREGIFEREVPKYTQIGNAVPVALARAVGDHLKEMLKKQ